MFSGMPNAALKRDHVDYCVKLSDMSDLLRSLISGSTKNGGSKTDSDSSCKKDKKGVQATSKEKHTDRQWKRSDITCPECRGPLAERPDEINSEFECKVGHRYSLESAVGAHL